MTKRLFETADKFWEVWIDGDSVYTRHGKTGSAGQTKLKPGGDAEMAKMIAAKQKEGFVEKGAKAPPLDQAELKRHLKNLDEDGAYLVLADWLQKQEHPWGELIALTHARDAAPEAKRGKLDKAVAQHLTAHGPVLLGDVATRAGSSFTWRRGFVDVATLGTDADAKSILAAVKEFVKQPIARDVTGVVVNAVPASFPTHRSWANNDDDVVDAWPELDKLRAAIPERIGHVGFGGWPAPAATAYVRMPAYSKIGTAFPDLKRLELTGYPDPKPGKLSLKALVDLEVRFGNADDAALAALSAWKLPKLERLAIWVGGVSYCVLDELYPPNYDDDDEDGEDRYPSSFTAADLDKLRGDHSETRATAAGLTALLDRVPATVVHLALRWPMRKGELLEALLGHRVLAQLTTLDLTLGTLEDSGVDALVGAKAALAHLARIDLTHNAFDDRTKPAKLAKLAKALPNAVLDPRADDADFTHRYVAVME